MIHHNHCIVSMTIDDILLQGRSESYVKFLTDWIKGKEFKHVVIIGSTFAYERLDCHIEGWVLFSALRVHFRFWNLNSFYNIVFPFCMTPVYPYTAVLEEKAQILNLNCS